MRHLASGLALVFSRKDSRSLLLLSIVVFFFFVLFMQNGKAAGEILSFDVVPAMERFALASSTLFDLHSSFSTPAILLVFLGSVIGGLNLALVYTYLRTRGELVLKSGLYSGLGLFFAFLGIGCAACGTALLSALLGFFGLSGVLALMPYGGMEVGYAGIVILFIATYVLSKKVTAPNVC